MVEVRLFAPPDSAALGSNDRSDAGAKTAIDGEGLAKIRVHRDEPAAAVLGRVIAQLDHRPDVAGWILHHVPGRFAISPARRPALVASDTITQLRRRCRVQVAKTRRSLMSSRESIFACLPDTLSYQVDHHLYNKIASN